MNEWNGNPNLPMVDEITHRYECCCCELWKRRVHDLIFNRVILCDKKVVHAIRKALLMNLIEWIHRGRQSESGMYFYMKWR